jgi:hypothetical protein
MALSPDQSELFVSDYYSHSIGVYDAATGAVINSALISGLEIPTHLAIDGQYLYVVDAGPGTIGKYNLDGTVVNAALVTGLSGGFQLGQVAVLGNALFIADSGKRVVGEYDATTGAPINAALISGLDYPSGLAVVPEPSAVTLAICGIAGLVLRLRIKNSAKIFSFCLLLCVCVSTANAQPYSAIDLYTLEDTAGRFIGFYDARSAAGGQVAGARVDIGPVFQTALLWNGPNGAETSLSTMDGTFSRIGATDGVHQVGYAYGPGGDDSHAIIWSGTPNSLIDLHPTKLPGVMTSEALGLGGGQQVGYASTNYLATGGHAVLWQGTADSVVDLHPTNLTGFSESFAFGTDGAKQVGMAGGEDSFYGSSTHAILWSGTAGSAVDLHPLAGFDTSKAVAISGLQQVGSGRGSSTGGNEHALLWQGSATSAVDLNPTLLTYINSSTANGTNGLVQVGWGKNGASNLTTALLWSSTSASAIDLGALLPATLNNSRALSVDADGNVWGVAVEAGGALHAVEWTLVPEPSTAILAIAAVLSFGLGDFARR